MGMLIYKRYKKYTKVTYLARRLRIFEMEASSLDTSFLQLTVKLIIIFR